MLFRSYNAYCLLDEKTVLFDTVDWSACRQLLENLAYVLTANELASGDIIEGLVDENGEAVQ